MTALRIASLLIVASTILPINPFFAQFCGTPTGELPPPEYFREIEHYYGIELRSPEVVRLGITIHVIEQIVGASGFDIQTLYDELDAVNRSFTGSGIQFYFCGSPRFVQGRSNYTYDQAATELNQILHVPNTINIYYLDEIGDSALGIAACGISTFPWQGKLKDRFIIMQKDCSAGGGILAHEIGHFFGLLHTHEPARGLEFVDGSNCSEAGDLVCDTPADPNLSRIGMLQGCNYIGEFVDAKGDLYTPNPSNVMSYAPARCLQNFTAGQRNRMNFFYESTDLVEILTDCDFYPDFSIASAQTGFKIISGQSLDLEFSFVHAGIEENQEVDLFFQLLNLDEFDTPFTLQKETVVMRPGNENFTQSFTIDFPLARGTGNYSITAVLDPLSLVQERDKRNNVHTLQVEVDNTGFQDLSLFPNPVEDELRVFIRDGSRGGDITIQIADYLGRVFLTEERFKKSEEFFTVVNTAGLQDGVYIINIIFERDEENQALRFIKGLR